MKQSKERGPAITKQLLCIVSVHVGDDHSLVVESENMSSGGFVRLMGDPCIMLSYIAHADYALVHVPP